MRRADREITKRSDIIKIIEKCDVCRLALNDRDYPYILPLNFGMAVKAGVIELYFHGAAEGTKFDRIQADNRASFEMDCEHELITELDRGYCTMEYESVIGQGHIEILSDEEKLEALNILMRQYHKEAFPFSKAALPRTKVYKLVVERVTGKIKRK